MANESVPFEWWTSWWNSSPYVTSLAAGGMAGLAVDMTLYPLDCIKTRRQAVGGLAKSGGLRNLYSGVQAVAVGSVPCSALFFVTYEYSKNSLRGQWGSVPAWAENAVAAALGEMVASVARVPTEIVKQRMQVGRASSVREAFKGMKGAGAFVGFRATLARDIPFSILQYPMYEHCKTYLSEDPLPAHKAACVGACTGALSAFITTPLDVCKTRTMLHPQGCNTHSPYTILSHIYRQEGLRGIYRGSLTRSAWMGVGGLIFLGTYEQAKIVLCGETDVSSRDWDEDRREKLVL